MSDKFDDSHRRAASDQQPPNWGSAYPSPPGDAYPQGPGQQPYAMGPPKHPQATTALVLGILGLVLCGILAPFAWSTGAKALREIDAAPWTYSGRSEANAGRILGIVGTALIGLGVVAFIGLFSLAVVA